MSVMRCEICERMVDTDFEDDGEWSSNGYTCRHCLDSIHYVLSGGTDE